MSNPVIKLAQPGFDVKTVGDENLIYSSKWPLLPIYKQDSVTFDCSQLDVTLATHDLGFPPVFWYFSNNTIAAWENSGVIQQGRRSEIFGPIGGGTLAVNEKRLFYTSSFPFMSGTSQLYFYIFALDLSVQYNAPIIKTGAVTGGNDGGFVFKIAKPNKNINSHDLSDFVLHSRARSPLIHSINPSPGTVTQFVVNHNLGYEPMFLAYIKVGGAYQFLQSGQGSAGSLLADTKNITFNDSSGKELTIVVLKDPFLLEYSRRVNI